MRGISYVRGLGEPKMRQFLGLYWGLADVRLLEPNSATDSMVVHVVMPLYGPGFCDELPHPEAYRLASRLLKEEMPKYGYELKYLDELKPFETVDWNSEEDRQFYAALAKEAKRTQKLMFGRMYLYSSQDEDKDL